MDPLFEDNHLLVLCKPAGLSTQPHPPVLDSLQERAKDWIKQKYEKKGNVYLEPIHRLDKPVRGLVLFARTSKALSRLQEMMREQHIFKTYRAWIEGVPPQEEGELIHYLRHDSHSACVVPPRHKEGKRAHLKYRLIREEGRRSLVEVQLLTGRYHQIRAQFAAINCPIVGDDKYGSKFRFAGEGIGLQHTRLEFPHPVTKEAVVVILNDAFA